MKIAVYTICKNEKQHIERWIESTEGADYRLIVDTGSTDGTMNVLDTISEQVEVYQTVIKPWRFDLARNFSIGLIPEDIDLCIALDMDEVLVDGWRELIEKAYEESSFDIDRLRYKYIWNFTEAGTPGLTYYGDKIHTRHGYRWVNPVHEVLEKDKRLPDEVQFFIHETLIEHHADNTKSRGQYYDLLKLAVKENPHNDRNAFYFARELYYQKNYVSAIEEFNRHLALPSAQWSAERSASMRLRGDCEWAIGKHENAIASFMGAHLEDISVREPLVALAQAHRARNEWEAVREYCTKALNITEKGQNYLNEANSWSGWIEQMLTEANKKLGLLF